MAEFGVACDVVCVEAWPRANLMALFNIAISGLVREGGYHEVFEGTTQKRFY